MFVPENIVIHHTVSLPGTGRAIASEKKYHLLLDPHSYRRAEQRIEVLQSVPDTQASGFGTGCYNSRAYAIALVGNYDVYPPTDELVHQLVQAIVIKMVKIPGPQGIVTHQHVGRVLAACRYGTACPGRYLIARVEQIRADVAKRL